MLTQSDARAVDFHGPAAYDEWVLEAPLLWLGAKIRVRLAARAATQADADRLAARLNDSGDAGGILIAPLGTSGRLKSPARVTIVEPAEFIARLERSPLVAWSDQGPTPSLARAAEISALENVAFLDPSVRWLPVLALNELPPQLSAAETAPQDQLERAAFRIFTATFRFGGERHGEAARGKRVPDSVLTWRRSAGCIAALTDCKAAGDGYVMTADDVLRFERYAKDAKQSLKKCGCELRYLVVLSSGFPGRSGSRHPYYARARELRASADIGLVYLRATDLARLAATVETRQLSPAARGSLGWDGLFAGGLINSEAVDALLETEA